MTARNQQLETASNLVKIVQLTAGAASATLSLIAFVDKMVSRSNDKPEHAPAQPATTAPPQVVDIAASR